MLPDRERLWASKRRRLALDRPCPYCDQVGRLAPACPVCWHPLDPEVGLVEDRMIAILGARQAGKTHFLAALLHQLFEGRVGGDAWSVEMEPEMRSTAERELLRPLFRDLRELPATELGSQLSLRLVLSHRDDRRRVLLRFQDLPGEAIADPERLARADFLRYASGVVLLADPLAFEAPDKGQRRSWYHDEPDCQEILESYRRVLDAAPRRRGHEELPLLPAQKFLAVAVTKADLLRPRGHRFWQPPNGGAHLAPGFWHARGADDEAAAAWLRSQLRDPHAFDGVTGLFADVSYFLVSNYGYVHKPHAGLRKRPDPLRVHEPVFALLDRFESAGARRAGAGRRRALPAPAPRRPLPVSDEDVL
jgi:GTPase SAR1 family protein